MPKRHLILIITTCLLSGCGSERQAGLTETGAESRDAGQLEVCAEDSAERLVHVPSPDWRDQVVYQMFIDRFNDGDPTNNDQGAGEFQADSPAHFNGGDMQGIIDKLPYLEDLGVTAIWVTPPVLNQWWSTPYDGAGWHGYWAANFKEVDPHFGSLDTYRDLSHELHCRGMYMIQDIVINHVGNFYAWDGPHDPDDPARNFYLIEENTPQLTAPTQFPFDKIDIRDPEHREIDAYHWTPAITDYDDPLQSTNYGFGLLADINTENPLVLDAFKDSYRYWIEEVGVDAYRIDTIGYVAWPFWHHFHHDEDGVYPSAEATGRENFLTFGEMLVPSEPFKTDGEEKILPFFGTEDEPGVNSMLGFPLYFSMRRALSEGRPAALLAYRLRQHMAMYPDPYVIPTFIDNHDTARFLATGGQEAFRQALALVFTIPGIPVVYQGTEQALMETRQSMFDGGWLGSPGIFDRQSAPFRLIRDLADLRTANPVFTRGSLEVLAGEELNAGLLAYRRDYQDETVIVLMNTADHAILINRLESGSEPALKLEPVFSLNFDGEVATDADGLLNLELPARTFLALRPAGRSDPVGESQESIAMTFDRLPQDSVLNNDTLLTGTTGQPDAELRLIINGNLDKALPFEADAAGNWEINLPVRDLGEMRNYLQVYLPASNTLSEPVRYTTRVTQPTMQAEVIDPPDDAHGPGGDYVIPQHSDSGRQREIESVAARAAGRNLELRLTMAEVSDVWVPNNGFDNAAFSIFFSFPEREGVRALPLINAEMPDGLDWNLAHVASGWFSYTYTADGATANEQGTKLGISPLVIVDKDKRSIRFFYEGEKLGVEDWRGVRVYLTSWDLNGEGGYVPIVEQPTLWYFSGVDPKSPLILDDLLLELTEIRP